MSTILNLDANCCAFEMLLNQKWAIAALNPSICPGFIRSYLGYAIQASTSIRLRNSQTLDSDKLPLGWRNGPPMMVWRWGAQLISSIWTSPKYHHHLLLIEQESNAIFCHKLGWILPQPLLISSLHQLDCISALTFYQKTAKKKELLKHLRRLAASLQQSDCLLNRLATNPRFSRKFYLRYDWNSVNKFLRLMSIIHEFSHSIPQDENDQCFKLQKWVNVKIIPDFQLAWKWGIRRRVAALLQWRGGLKF